MCDRLVLDSSERDDRHGALLDADMSTKGDRAAEIMDPDLTA
jgi:hypothetical protein